MIESAFARAVATAQDHYDEDLIASLRPPLPAETVASELNKMGVEAHPDLLAWFALHNGGNASSPFHWQLLSVSEAADARVDIQQLLAGSEETGAWLPIRRLSQTTTVVDASSGEVLNYDLVMGLSYLAASLTSWIVDEVREAGGEVDDLEHEAPKSRKLSHPEPAETVGLSGTASVAGTSLPSQAPVSHSPTQSWTPANGTIAAWHLLADGNVLVAVVRDNELDLVLFAPQDQAAVILAANLERSMMARFKTSSDQTLVLLSDKVLFDTVRGTVRQLRDIFPEAGPEATLKFTGDCNWIALNAPDGPDRVADLENGTTRSIQPDAGFAGSYVLWFTEEGLIGERLDGTQRFEATAASLGLSSLRTYPHRVQASMNGDIAVVSLNDDNVLAIRFFDGRIWPPHGVRMRNQSPKTLFITDSGDRLIVEASGFPTSQLAVVGLGDQGTTNFGLPHPEDAQSGTLSDDQRFFAHLGLDDQHRKVIELIDLDDFSSSTIVTHSSGIDQVGYTIAHGPGHIAFHDVPEDGVFSTFIAPTGPNGLGQPVRLNGDNAVEGDSTRFFLDGTRVAWLSDGSPHWSGLDGSAPGRLDVGVQVDWNGWGRTATDAIVVHHGNQLDFFFL